ncbi:MULTISPECIES: KPN_02809 family neutral zinc metallopeptidase [Deefgea]|uniref:Flagellar biosynthesis protein FlgM n=1 Tax=Deefgea chitinilytica TaxID=570276 RepID=A0ABS2CA46_9NEIS|nr:MULTISPECIES: neutral zinc metallopeptidase [Deefgea]MBM5571018.1 flagellar biosynthesis protein FlgM [Deefgea chitinilytica]MBM9888248.1 zinc metallopeptidase [Deefgea sp. CFH1-16]
MRWDKMSEDNSNVEDRRASGGSGGRGGKLSLAGIAIVVVIGLLMGKNPVEILGMVMQSSNNGAPTQQAGPVNTATDNDQVKSQAVKTLTDTQDTWHAIFQQSGQSYQEPKMVLFRNRVDTACGNATSAVGPFYCPADSKVYLDLGFFDEMHKKLGAPGDFAQAYVIAHEVGHHIQNLTGISSQVHQKQQQLSKAKGNALSVRLELQADCYAGVWGHYAAKKGLLEAGDLEEALTAANAIGDDTLQRNAGHSVMPDSFTHGTSEQRMKWFKRGMDSGDAGQCDTFNTTI